MTTHIRRTDEDPFGMGGLANAPAFPGGPGFGPYIEAQEKQGQRELVESTDLPSRLNGGSDDDFIALGFAFGEPHARDPLFRPATLPEGWRREGSGHAMWSYILDEKGRQRVSIFYKAAFYDRDAFMSLVGPYAVFTELIYGDAEPTSIPIDERLTVEMAREYLDRERAEAVRYGELGLDRGDKVARIDALLALLPEEKPR